MGSPISRSRMAVHCSILNGRYPEDEDGQNGEQQLASCHHAGEQRQTAEFPRIDWFHCCSMVSLPTFEGDCWRCCGVAKYYILISYVEHMGFHCFNHHFAIHILPICTLSFNYFGDLGPGGPIETPYAIRVAAMDGKMGGHEPSMAQRPGRRWIRWCHGSFNDVPSGWFTTTGWGLQKPFLIFFTTWKGWLVEMTDDHWDEFLEFRDEFSNTKKPPETQRNHRPMTWLTWSLQGPRDAQKRRLGDGRTTDLVEFCVELPEILNDVHWFNHWLVVWNMNGLFSISYMGCHPSHWLSYFSEGWLNHQPHQIQ